ncbi:MAG: CoA-binding protein, partial [Phaeodactylibacter sp.]|nr:CoA-binding protein [Phaeodactylibacter sp.]
MRLRKIFEPKSIAIVGATERAGAVGRAVYQNVTKGGFKGPVYPVNLKHRTVFGARCYAYLSRLPEVPDLVVISTPRQSVITIVEQAGKLGVGGLIILTAGFKEAGTEGKRLQRELLRAATKYKLPIGGPNCLGLIHPYVGLNATFAGKNARQGRIAFISQSGALGSSILDWADDQQVGFSYFVSVGDMLNVDYGDLIDYLGMDSHTSSILIYMESLNNARKFMSAAQAFARRKPIIVLKSGKSSEGAQATRSHTGALAGNDSAYDAAFQRAGIVRVRTVAELFNCARALATQSRPENNQLLIITNAGGPGVLATDRLIEQGGKLATLSKTTVSTLDEALPRHCSRNNPIDLRGDASTNLFQQALEIASKDPAADGLLVIFAPQGVTDSASVADQVVHLNRHYHKPILA